MVKGRIRRGKSIAGVAGGMGALAGLVGLVGFIAFVLLIVGWIKWAKNKGADANKTYLIMMIIATVFLPSNIIPIILSSIVIAWANSSS